MQPPPFITHDLLATGGIAHGFFTREGGVSRGGYASLNGGIGSGDDAEHVETNRALAATAIGGKGADIRSLYQIHSATIHEADPMADTRPHGDGLVTGRSGLTLTILTADCAPVLLADTKAGVIGAAHAGWKGAAAGVIPAICAAMSDLGAKPENIRAVIGPAIGRESYQVGADMRVAVLAAKDAPEDAGGFFRPDGKAGKYRFDLAGFVAAQLGACGIAKAAAIGLDTYTDSRFFSHRRHGHEGGRHGNGRMLNLIRLA